MLFELILVTSLLTIEENHVRELVFLPNNRQLKDDDILPRPLPLQPEKKKWWERWDHPFFFLHLLIAIISICICVFFIISTFFCLVGVLIWSVGWALYPWRLPNKMREEEADEFYRGGIDNV